MKINLELIKEKRKKRKLNIDDMADNLGLTNGSMYYKREVGDYKFKAEELMMVSEILNIPWKDLFLRTKYSKKEII